MPIGQKMGSIKKLKASLKKGQMGQIRYIPKNGSLTVRFLEEPENWVNYHEHFDSMRRLSYPCIENGCPGCATEERRTSRYLANALNVDDDRVIALQLPKDLTNRLVGKYERNDTIMDRDYTLTRDGEGFDTTYDADAEPPLNRKLTKYELLDLEEVLDGVVKSVIGVGEDDEEEEDTPPPKQTAAGKRARAQVVEDDEEDEEPAPPKKKFKSPPARQEVEEDDEDEDDEDDEDDEEVDDTEEGEDDDEEEESFTEEELQALPLGELRSIAREAGIDTAGMKKADLIELMLDGDEDDEEEDEDEEPF